MTNQDMSGAAPNPMPMAQNINIIGVATALLALLVAFGFNITPDQRNAILTLLAVTVPAALALIHTFINHPANVQRAMAYGCAMELKARSTARKGVGTLLAFVLIGSMLMGCAAIPVPTDPNSILNTTQAAFNGAVLVYNGICAVDAGASFCTANDQATAAALEQAVANAITVARAAITLNPANLPAALQAAQQAVTDFENFVNHMQSAKAAKLAAKLRSQ